MFNIFLATNLFTHLSISAFLWKSTGKREISCQWSWRNRSRLFDIDGTSEHKWRNWSCTVANFTNILWAAFGLISFCQKIINTNCKQIKTTQNTFMQKAACKMLVKLTPVANFTKILWAAFLNECVSSSFSLNTVLLRNFLAKYYVHKSWS